MGGLEDLKVDFFNHLTQRALEGGAFLHNPVDWLRNSLVVSVLLEVVVTFLYSFSFSRATHDPCGWASLSWGARQGVCPCRPKKTPDVPECAGERRTITRGWGCLYAHQYFPFRSFFNPLIIRLQKFTATEFPFSFSNQFRLPSRLS